MAKSVDPKGKLMSLLPSVYKVSTKILHIQITHSVHHIYMYSVWVALISGSLELLVVAFLSWGHEGSKWGDITVVRGRVEL